MKLELFTCSFLLILIFVNGITEETEKLSSSNVTSTIFVTTPATATSKPITVSTTPNPNPAIECQKFNTCDSCLSYSSSCFFCEKTKQCHYYTALNLVKSEICDTYANMEALTCLMSFRSLMILFGVLGGIVVLSFACLCCYCCCCRGKKNPLARDEARWAREREERKAKAEERRKERQSRTDEIRRKYGLLLDASGLIKGDNPYQKFDA